MPVSLSTVCIDCVLALNAGSPGAYSATVVDPRWSTAQIVDAVLTADAMVNAAMLQSDYARISSLYVTQAGLAHGGLLVDAAGPVATVKFVVSGGTRPGTRAAVIWEKEEIEAEIRSVLPLDYDPHYWLDGQFIYHNGSAIAARSGGGTVSVNVTFPGFARTSTPQAPAEYQHAVFVGAMSMLTPVEGENAGMAGTWGQEFETLLKMVASRGPVGAPEQKQGS